MQCDIGSLYLRLARPTVDIKWILQSKRNEWLEQNTIFVSDSEELVLLEGQKITKQIDKRTPGLYEYSGKGMIAL